MPASEVVKKATAAGVKVTTAYVYVIRSQARRKAGKSSAHHGRSSSHKTTHTVGSHRAEDLLRAVAAELGLAHAMTILKAEHDRVHRLLS